MEIENKDFYNQSLKGILKMQLGVWRPFTIHPVLLWPVFATHISFIDKYFVRHTHSPKIQGILWGPRGARSRIEKQLKRDFVKNLHLKKVRYCIDGLY